MTINDALLALDLKTPVSHDAVRKAFRNKAKQVHPDKLRDSTLHREASNQFVLARKAYDLLLSLSVETINNPAVIRRSQHPVRRTRKYQAPVVKNVEHPFIKDLDNVARLFHFVSEKGISKPFLKKLQKLNLSPGAVLGSLYERWVEKVYANDIKWHGIVYAIFRGIKLLLGSLFLITSFLVISIVGMGVMVFLFPSGLAFMAVYTIYTTALDCLNKYQTKQKQNSKRVIGNQLIRLMAKTTALVFCSFICLAFILAAQTGTYYIQTLSWVFSMLFLVPAFSAVYEWVLFYKKK